MSDVDGTGRADGRTDAGIVAAGTYVPGLRVSADAIREGLGRFLASGVQEKAVPEVDEDAVTMAYEAATRALAAANRNAGDVDLLAFASTTPPMAEEDQTVRIGELLGVPAAASRTQFGGSARAGTRALAAGNAAVDAGDASVALVVASDCPPGDPDTAFGHAAGAGAAAFVIEPDGAVTVESVTEYATEYPGTRFRPTGEDALDGLDITTYDRGAFADVAAGALAAADVDVDDLAAAVVQAPDGDLPYRGARACGLSTDLVAEYATVGAYGDTGAASVPLSLAHALADGPGSVLALSVGSGSSADAVVLSAPTPIPVDRDEETMTALDYAGYLKRTADVTRDQPEGGGAYVSAPTWKRTLPQRYRFEGGRCLDCGALAFVPDGACAACESAAGFEHVQLSRRGVVETFTTISQGGAPPEFVEQQAAAGDFAVAIVAFDGPDGNTASVPAQVLGDPADLSIGNTVEATVRRIYEQEAVIRYGFKVRPVDA